MSTRATQLRTREDRLIVVSSYKALLVYLLVAALLFLGFVTVSASVVSDRESAQKAGASPKY